MTPEFPKEKKVPELTGLLTQTSTNAPVLTTLINTTGKTFTTSYIGVGTYKLNCTGLFVQDKIFIIMEYGSGLSSAYRTYMFSDGNPDWLNIYSFAGVSTQDGVLNKTNFKIQIYNL